MKTVHIDIRPSSFTVSGRAAAMVDHMVGHMLRLMLALVIALALDLSVGPVSAMAADEPPTSQPIPIAAWLRLGPVPTPLPAFHDASEHGYAVEDLLESGSLNPRDLQPAEDASLVLGDASKHSWKAVPVWSDGGGLVPTRSDTVPAEAYLAVYLAAERWLKAELTLGGEHPVHAFLDGAPISLKDKPQDEDHNATKTQTAELEMSIGKHLLLLHTVFDPAQESPWSGLTAALGLPDTWPAEALQPSTDPVRAVDIRDVLDAPRISAAAVSADGELVATVLRAHDKDGKEERWLEIRRLKDGRLVASRRGGFQMGGVQWAPAGHRLSYTTVQDDAATIWQYDLDTGQTTRLAGDIAKLGTYRWAPDETFLIYSFTEEPEPDERKVKRVRHPADRQPTWRHRSHLVRVALPDGAARRLTSGPLSAESWSLSPDGQRLLFFRSDSDLTERPYSTSELWELNLATLAATPILSDRWIGAAAYGPDPDVLALQGSPSAFGGLGQTLPEDVTPNDYGGQLYLYNLKTKAAEPVSRTFDPDINSIQWSHADGRIYAVCTDTQYRRLYSFEPGSGKWRPVDAGLEFIRGLGLAARAKQAVAYGTSVATPSRLMAIDLRRGKSKLLMDPGADRYRDITFGKVEPWTCTLPDGEKLDGRVYYPRNFDPGNKYPLIVYYYGGTSPVTRDYGGRYPKNIWAGQDYVVYVPEPSGATGYGQEFAARHVNDWGRRTAGEVISGTKAFLAAHSFADPTRVGCIGASYGGFLTQYILTQTDIFAAGVSHAGISSISSYWGAGFWGYAYGARALAHSFPWSHRDLYIEQSPLFHADKIHTPLLLLHGGVDVNVPVGESIQLFTALKMLDREVEFIRIEEQDHHILDHDQRVVWNDTILAYFAKWLKGQSEWWEHLYPESEEPESQDS